MEPITTNRNFVGAIGVRTSAGHCGGTFLEGEK